MLRKLLLSLALLVCLPLTTNAAVLTMYVDSGGCNTGSTSQCSGSTDSATASASGAAATITCSAVAGPAGGIGCSITGSAGQLGSIATDSSQTLFVNCATNTNQKVFKINAVDNGAGLVGTTLAPTGCTAASSDWGIGGRLIFPSGATVNNFEAVLAAGDTVIINNDPASKSVAFFNGTFAAGDSTSGFMTIRGKAGVRPVLTQTGTTAVINTNTKNNIWIENLELRQTAASGTIVPIGAAINNVLYNVKVSHPSGGGSGLGLSGNGSNGVQIINCEFDRIGGDAISLPASGSLIFGTYVHDGGGNGVTVSSAGTMLKIVNSVFDSNAGKGVYISGAATSQTSTVLILGNTFYNNSVAGLQIADADQSVAIINNIFVNDGTHANVVWEAGTAELVGFHFYNVFYASGGTNLTGLTANATESTSNPLLTDPANGDFSIPSTSPANGTGFPGTLLGSATTGHMSMGIYQFLGTAGGGGGFIIGGG